MKLHDVVLHGALGLLVATSLVAQEPPKAGEREKDHATGKGTTQTDLQAARLAAEQAKKKALETAGNKGKKPKPAPKKKPKK